MTIGRPFQKGQSGNPGGRPKTRPFKEAIDRAIERAERGDDGAISMDDIADALFAKAKSGDTAAIRELADRTDGKVVQGLEHSGPEGEPIEMISDNDAVRRMAHMMLKAKREREEGKTKK